MRSDHPKIPADAACILIVDDNQECSEALNTLLTRRDFRVRTAITGAQALASVAADPPDLILLDVNLPDMDGYSVCATIKKDPRFRDLPILFVSGKAETFDVVRGFQCGGVDYVTKPFQFEELAARMRTHLNLRQLRLELERHNRNLQVLVRSQVKEISDSQMAAILALSSLVDSRDGVTGNHIMRIQEFCRVLALQLRKRGHFAEEISDSFISNLFHASPLHDIGKVGIPDRVLLKPALLTPEEFEEIKKHTLIGAQTLEAVRNRDPNNAFINMGIAIARSHHEHYDGTGYPDGLAGDAIPLPARILTLADQYDALRSPRPYKEAFTHERTCEILLKGDERTMPAHFDPAVLVTFPEIAADFAWIYDSRAS